MSYKQRVRELEDCKALEAAVRAVRDDEVAEEQCEAAQRNLLLTLQESSRENLLMTLIKATKQHKDFGLATAASLAIIIAVAAIVLAPGASSAAHAYETVVNHLRDVLVLRFQAEWTMQPGGAPTTVNIALRKPALQRTEMEYQGAKLVEVFETDSGRALMMMPETRMALKLKANTDVMVSADRQRREILRTLTSTIKDLPEKADDVITGETSGSLQLAGFKVGSTVLWVELETESLVKIERQFGTSRYVMSNFEFDPPDMDESMFSLEPPQGYTLMSQQVANLSDPRKASETDVVDYLGYMAKMTKTHQFPSTINPMEVLSLQKQGKLVEENPQTTPEEKRRFMEAFAQSAQRSMMFVMTMKAENDWTYRGDGVVLGDANKPIAWWKPAGATQHRILWGDLRLTDGERPMPK